MNWEHKYTITRIRLREAMRNQIPVRCVECKYCKVDQMGSLFCDIMYEDDGTSATVQPADFCSWGKKE